MNCHQAIRFGKSSFAVNSFIFHSLMFGLLLCCGNSSFGASGELKENFGVASRMMQTQNRVISQIIPLSENSENSEDETHQILDLQLEPQTFFDTVYQSNIGSSNISNKENTGQWNLLSTIPAYGRRIKFADKDVGYIAAGQGLVYKTTNGGQSWQQILFTNSSHHWYGLSVRGPNIIIVGFSSLTADLKGIMRFSRDGGTTWSNEMVLSRTDWLINLEFAYSTRGFIIGAALTTDPPQIARSLRFNYRSSDWHFMQPPNVRPGWYGEQMSALPSGRVDISGSQNCTSRDLGATWTCRGKIDSAADGVVKFITDNHGFVAGGIISPNQLGWVHLTTDGGTTWSDRKFVSPFPIRYIHFIDTNTGWAVGGDFFTSVGGAYYTADGGHLVCANAN